MNLYVLRHAEAVRSGEGIRRDAERPLSAQGAADAALVGGALARLDPAIAHVLCSPLRRARQTAEVVAAQFSRAPDIRETESLSPGFRPGALIERLQEIPADESVAVVGHQPDLGSFLAFVIEGESALSITLPPAAVAHVRFDGDVTTAASLRWLVGPDIIKALLSPR